MMQPEKDDFTIKIPITFNYTSGRRDNSKTQILALVAFVFINFIFVSSFVQDSVIKSLLTLFYCILLSAFIFLIMNRITSVFNTVVIGLLVIIIGGLLYGRSLDLLPALAKSFVTTQIIIFILRFKIFNEILYSDAYEDLLACGYKPKSTCFWQIYETERQYPYICHYKDGSKGIFVFFEKDVIVGKSDTVMYDHYEAISEAYNRVSSLDIEVTEIDYMDNVGNDSRLNILYGNATNCINPSLKSLLNMEYSHLEKEMKQDYSSYDVYLFKSNCRDEIFWSNVLKVVSEIKRGNYLAFRVLDQEGLRKLNISLLNLKDFSATEACNTSAESDNFSDIVPIKITHSNGEETKLNSTREEVIANNKAKLEEEKQKKVNKKKNKKPLSKSIRLPKISRKTKKELDKSKLNSKENLKNR